MENIDFLGIGDITTDAFIRLKDAQVHCDINNDDCTICMRFGDKIPFEDATVVPAVGNSPNAATSAHRLGLNSALLTWVGDDQFAKEDLAHLKEEGLSTDLVQQQEGMGTNYHYVLSYEAERTILVKHYEYDYALPEFPEPTFMYLSSLAENSLPFHHEIATYLEQHPDVKLAFQPGTFQMKLGYENLKDLYAHTYLFFCNKEEAQRILETDETELTKLTSMMHERGPVIPIITDGPDGAIAYDSTKDTHYFAPMYPDPKPPVERTGAGDSFSSTVTSALALGEDLPTALSWGPINSMNVVQHIGAQKGLLSKEKLLEYLANGPEDYKVTTL